MSQFGRNEGMVPTVRGLIFFERDVSPVGRKGPSLREKLPGELKFPSCYKSHSGNKLNYGDRFLHVYRLGQFRILEQINLLSSYVWIFQGKRLCYEGHF